MDGIRRYLTATCEALPMSWRERPSFCPQISWNKKMLLALSLRTDLLRMVIGALISQDPARAK